MAEEKKSEGMQMLEVRGIIRMMKATAEMARDLRMTGSENEVPKAGIRQYNAVVERLNKYASEDLFMPLEEDASLVDLSICCEQAGAYLEGIAGELVEEGKAGPSKIQGPIISIGRTGDNVPMKELGRLIREAMPAWLREQMEEEETEEVERSEADMNDLESRIAELGAQMQVLAERMHREELSSDEIRKLADQMRDLGQQQSELARRHAAIRARKASDEAIENDS